MVDFTNLQVYGVPVITYLLIGVTTGVLAYATSISGIEDVAEKTAKSIGEVTSNPAGVLGSIEEPAPPAEESAPPAEESAPPAEESAPPAEESAPPAEESESSEVKGGNKKHKKRTPKSKSKSKSKSKKNKKSTKRSRK
jgi:hypothetical protein